MKIPALRFIYFLIFNFVLTAIHAQNTDRHLSLNGTWEIVFDSKNVGKIEQLHLEQYFDQNSNKQEIDVPSSWETIKEDYEGVAFYKKSFAVPKEWDTGIVSLHFEAVNYKAEVWLNDQAVGVHEGGFTPFSFEVDEVIKPGEENHLTLRIVGPILMTDQVIDEMGRMELPQWRGAITGGIWQDVWLEHSGTAVISDVFIQPDIDKSAVSLDLALYNHKATAQKVVLAISVQDNTGKQVGIVTKNIILEPGDNPLVTAIEIPNQNVWSPDNPYLYSLDVSLSNGETLSDKWSYRFGMRKFTIENKQFYLNNEPLYLKATFFEGLYPVGLAYPDSKEMAIREIQLAKDAGFNMIRPWRKPPPKMWLDICDEMGVLTVGSLVIECMERPLQSAYLPMRVENELTQTILRDRNRTCVVMWELFNELIQPVMIQMLRPMSLKARALDPTRLILDESGGWAKGARMYLPNEKFGKQFNDIHDYSGSQITESIYDGYANIGATKEELKAKGLSGLRIPGKNIVPGRLSFVSELGYGSLPNLPQNNKVFAEKGNPITSPMRYHLRLEKELKATMITTGFDKLFDSFEDFCLAQQTAHGITNKRLLESTRSNSNVIGYCVHALTAGDWIIGAGLLDLWRNPKTDVYNMTKAANQKQIVTLRVKPRNSYAGLNPTVEVIGVNEATKKSATAVLEIYNAQGEMILVQKSSKQLKQGVTRYIHNLLDLAGKTGAFVAKVQLLDNTGNTIAKNSFDFDVIDAAPMVAKTAIQLIDSDGSLKKFLEQKNITTVEYNPKYNKGGLIISGLIKNDQKRKAVSLLKEAKAAVAKGANLLILDVPGKIPPYFSRKFESNGTENLPFSASMLNTGNTLGLWAGRPHMVKPHPIFDGLPKGVIMQGVYQNIHPKTTMMMQEGNIISGVVSYDHFKNVDKMLRHYPGPGDVWYGANVLEVSHGNGQMLLSTLDIISHLGTDPVAEKVLHNMMKHLQKK